MNQVAKASSSAVAALSNLKTGLQNVQSTIVSAGTDPFLRLLQDGVWVFGAENVEVQAGSRWAVNPLSLMHGWVSWTDHPGKQTNEVVGEVMVPMTSPLPPQTELRDTGWSWSQQLQIQLKCIDGEDTGEQVLYKTTSVGGMSAVKGLIGQLMKQLDIDPDQCVPVVELATDHYMHKKWGKTYTPVFDIVGWTEMSEEGEQAAKATARSSSTPEDEPVKEQPKARERGGAASGKTADAKSDSSDADAKRRALLAELEKLEGEASDSGSDEVQNGTQADEQPTVRRRRRS